MITVSLSDPGLKPAIKTYPDVLDARRALVDSKYTEAFLTKEGVPVETWKREPGDAWSFRPILVFGDKVSALNPDGSDAFMGRVEAIEGDHVLIRTGERGQPETRTDLWLRGQIIRH